MEHAFLSPADKRRPSRAAVLFLQALLKNKACLMATFFVYLQMWCFAFAMFVAISSFRTPNYPQNVEKWTKSSMLWQAMSIGTIIACSIALFETYKANFGGGGGGMGDTGGGYY